MIQGIVFCKCVASVQTQGNCESHITTLPALLMAQQSSDDSECDTTGRGYRERGHATYQTRSASAFPGQLNRNAAPATRRSASAGAAEVDQMVQQALHVPSSELGGEVAPGCAYPAGQAAATHSIALSPSLPPWPSKFKAAICVESSMTAHVTTDAAAELLPEDAANGAMCSDWGATNTPSQVCPP